MKMRRWILLDLWVLSLAVISCYGGTVSYGIFWGITLIPVVSGVYLLSAYWNLKIMQQLESKNMVCGQAMPYLFVLQNESFCLFAGISVNMFSSFSTVEELPGDKEYELLPKDKKTFETRLTCKYRGEYEVGVKEIVLTDFFRLFCIRYRVPHAVKARVLPKVTSVAKLNSVDNFSMFLRKESVLERTEPDIVVRDYIAGDAPKQIHWKASAKEGKLKVRNRTGEEKTGISLFWDTRRFGTEQREYLPVEDKMLETVLALGNFLAGKNIPFWAYCGQTGVMAKHVEGIGDFDGFYQRVSEVIFDRDENLGVLLSLLLGQGQLVKSRIVFGVMHQIDETVMRMTEEFDRAGIMTVFYVVTDENMEDYARQSTQRHKIIVVPVSAELDGLL